MGLASWDQIIQLSIIKSQIMRFDFLPSDPQVPGAETEDSLTAD